MVRSKRNKKKSTKNYELPLSNPHTQSLEMCVKVKTQPASGLHNLTNLETHPPKKNASSDSSSSSSSRKKTSKINIFRGPLDFNQFKRLLWLVFSLSFRWTLGVSRVKRYGKFIMKKLLCFFLLRQLWSSTNVFRCDEFQMIFLKMKSFTCVAWGWELWFEKNFKCFDDTWRRRRTRVTE